MNYHRVPIWFSPSMWNVLNVVLFGKMTPYYPYRCYCCKAGYLKKKHSVSQSSCKHAGHSQLSHTYRFISAVIGVLVWVWKMCRNSKANKNWSCHIHYYAKVSTRLLIEVFFFFFKLFSADYFGIITKTRTLWSITYGIILWKNLLFAVEAFHPLYVHSPITDRSQEVQLMFILYTRMERKMISVTLVVHGCW